LLPQHRTLDARPPHNLSPQPVPNLKVVTKLRLERTRLAPKSTSVGRRGSVEPHSHGAQPNGLKKRPTKPRQAARRTGSSMGTGFGDVSLVPRSLVGAETDNVHSFLRQLQPRRGTRLLRHEALAHSRVLAPDRSTRVHAYPRLFSEPGRGPSRAHPF
jgi:hypothetical protein